MMTNRQNDLITKKQPVERKYQWLISGIIFGVVMFVVSFFIHDFALTPRNIMISFVIWMIGGLFYGLIMKWFFFNPRSKKKNELEK